MPPRKKQKTEKDEEKKPPGDGKSPKKTTPAAGKSSKTRSKSPAAPTSPPGVTTHSGASTAPPEEACTDPEKVMKANRALRREAEDRNAASLAELKERNAALEAEAKRGAGLLAEARKRNVVLLAEAIERNAAVFDEAEQRNAAWLAESRRDWPTLLAEEEQRNAAWLTEAFDGDQENVPLSKLKLGKREKPEESGKGGTAKKADVEGKMKSDAAAKSTTNGGVIKKAVDVDGKVKSDAAAKSWSIEAEVLAEAKRLSKGKMKMTEDSSSAMVHLDWTSVTDFTPKLTAEAVAAEVLRLSKGKSDVMDWEGLYELILQMTDIDKAAKEAAAKKAAPMLSHGKSTMTSYDFRPVKKRGKKNTSGTKIIMIRYCNASGPLFVNKAEELKTAITALGWKAVFDTIVAKGYIEVREAGGGESIVQYENLSPPYDELRKLDPETVIPLLVDYFFNE